MNEDFALLFARLIQNSDGDDYILFQKQFHKMLLLMHKMLLFMNNRKAYQILFGKSDKSNV